MVVGEQEVRWATGDMEPADKDNSEIEWKSED
jgi:hypothetical protein